MQEATKHLIQGYIQKAEKKLQVAEKLLQSSDFEDAVSRAYYFDKSMGRFLANLKDDRESGDYEVFSFIGQDEAETAIREAKEFVKQASEYLKQLQILPTSNVEL